MPRLPRILLVDDDETVNFINLRLLQRLEAADEVLPLTSGEQALALLGQPPPYVPTLVLLDLNMASMSGVEFLQRYQQLPAAQRAVTMVLVLTIHARETTLQHLQQLPASGGVGKPLTEAKVRQLMAQYFPAYPLEKTP